MHWQMPLPFVTRLLVREGPALGLTGCSFGPVRYGEREAGMLRHICAIIFPGGRPIGRRCPSGWKSVIFHGAVIQTTFPRVGAIKGSSGLCRAMLGSVLENVL